jgi:formylglycine-generating enzyme required for sulfatase activity
MDMAGNVWEWMENLEEGKYPALRGGSWRNVATDLRCSARDCHHPRSQWSSGGFRVLRGLAPSL